MVLKDLGITIPEQVFSEQFLLKIFNEIFQDLARSTETRLKIPHLSTLSQLVNLFRFSTRIIFLIGAGASVAAGIPDFRSTNGVYSRLTRFNLNKPTDMFDLAFFKENPLPFFRFCPEIVPQDKYKPTFTHYFIKRLAEKQQVLRIYTQNIDCLESKVGLPEHLLINCHGSFATASCVTCGYKVPIEQYQPIVVEHKIPLCPRCNNSEGIV